MGDDPHKSPAFSSAYLVSVGQTQRNAAAPAGRTGPYLYLMRAGPSDGKPGDTYLIGHCECFPV